MSQLTLVTGAGGFIGGHLVRALLTKGVAVRAVDKKPLDDWYFCSPQAENLVADLQLADACNTTAKGVAHVYNLACDMGGVGFIEANRARCCRYWGDGEQRRTFMYVDDCLYGTQMLLHSDVEEPLNIGSDELVTINRLVDVVEEIAGVKLNRRYNLDAPKGVRSRNSNNTLIKAKLGWAPSIPLRVGMEQTYRWIYDQAEAREERRPYIAAAA